MQRLRAVLPRSLNRAGWQMTGAELREARQKLGTMWGLGRPLRMAELARALRLNGRDPGQTIRGWERDSGPTGPASVAVAMMLAGARPAVALTEIVMIDK